VVTRSGESEPRQRTFLHAGLGVLGAIAVLVAFVVPVIVMLMLAPRGTPTVLPDGLSLALLAVAGIVVGLLVRVATRRAPFAITATVLLVLLALWFPAGTWWFTRSVPAPPLLPNVGPSLAYVAGVFLAVAVVVATRGGTGATAAPARGHGPAVVPGILAAAALVAVVEADVWGRDVVARTFQGPWGLGRFTWLTLVFLAIVLAGAFAGWLVATATSSSGPALALGLLVLGVAVIWVAGGGLGGPPRSTLYGVGLGLFATTTAIATTGSTATIDRR
jgi:hypothetical protein